MFGTLTGIGGNQNMTGLTFLALRILFGIFFIRPTHILGRYFGLRGNIIKAQHQVFDTRALWHLELVLMTVVILLHGIIGKLHLGNKFLRLDNRLTDFTLLRIDP